MVTNRITRPRSMDVTTKSEESSTFLLPDARLINTFPLLFQIMSAYDIHIYLYINNDEKWDWRRDRRQKKHVVFNITTYRIDNEKLKRKKPTPFFSLLSKTKLLQIVNLNTDLIFIKISSDNRNHKAFNHDRKLWQSLIQWAREKKKETKTTTKKKLFTQQIKPKPNKKVSFWIFQFGYFMKISEEKIYILYVFILFYWIHVKLNKCNESTLCYIYLYYKL